MSRSKKIVWIIIILAVIAIGVIWWWHAAHSGPYVPPAWGRDNPPPFFGPRLSE